MTNACATRRRQPDAEAVSSPALSVRDEARIELEDLIADLLLASLDQALVAQRSGEQ
jgi:hypothetical protein